MPRQSNPIARQRNHKRREYGLFSLKGPEGDIRGYVGLPHSVHLSGVARRS
jgi:hypothetical protein